MITQFIYSFQSEWLKTRRTFASWLVILGSSLVPLILLFARIIYKNKLPKEATLPDFWQRTFSNCWQPMAFFLLPMGLILASTLITQIEYRNNSWKQLHTTPQAYTTIFFAKLSVILTMVLQFFILTSIFIYLSGIIPYLLTGIELPQQSFPFWYFLEKSSILFVACLPIVALQYLISLQFKNFLVPLGIGLGLQVASLIAVEWQYGYWIPYTYCPYQFFALKEMPIKINVAVNLQQFELGYFFVLTFISFLLYYFKEEKG